jgi:hypothetical protein
VLTQQERRGLQLRYWDTAGVLQGLQQWRGGHLLLLLLLGELWHGRAAAVLDYEG